MYLAPPTAAKTGGKNRRQKPAAKTGGKNDDR
ncbi:MAG: hypothetical protein ACI91F_002492, partial [Candidatus Binatia bacterium]